MNTSGTRVASPLSIPLNARHSFRQPKGFSLVEVLITTLLVSIGLLGMAALQGRAVAYGSDAEHRGTAAMLAHDLLELMRAAPIAWAHYLNHAHQSPTVTAPCRSTPSEPAAQLACWQAEIDALLPQSGAPAGQGSYVCRSATPGQCSTGGHVIEIQVAWKATTGECPGAEPATLCHYRLRGEI